MTVMSEDRLLVRLYCLASGFASLGAIGALFLISAQAEEGMLMIYGFPAASGVMVLISTITACVFLRKWQLVREGEVVPSLAIGALAGVASWMAGMLCYWAIVYFPIASKVEALPYVQIISGVILPGVPFSGALGIVCVLAMRRVNVDGRSR